MAKIKQINIVMQEKNNKLHAEIRTVQNNLSQK